MPESKARKRKPTKFPETVTVSELAELADCTERTIGNWRDAGILRTETRGEYPFRESVKSIIARYKSEAAGHPAQRAADQARQARADADSAELDAAHKANKLMFRADARLLWAAGLVQLRAVVSTAKISAAQKKAISAAIQKIRLEDSGN